MVILRYWQLFHGKPYTLNGKNAGKQVLKYYNGDDNKGVEGTENCDEEQTKRIRSRTRTQRSFFSNVGCGFMKSVFSN